MLDRTRTALLLKGRPGSVFLPRTGKKTGTRRRTPRIRCPKCAGEPGRHDRWMCVCLHSWNTFETQGVCPGCGLKWTKTQCLRCTRWSRHEEWYEEDDAG